MQAEAPAETSEELEETKGEPVVEPVVEPVTDPTVAHASMTEIDGGTAIALTNGHASEGEEAPTSAHPPNADVANGAANEVAESQWENTGMTMSQEWVQVPRDPAETETGFAATPAAPANTQSWADEQPENPPEVQTPADPNDGFHQVPSRRGRGDREGHWRGGGRGSYRGRGGYRGDGRGRGRGGGRGGAPYRGGRRTEES